MKREIYEVYAKIVDANGAYNTLTGYPKYFDSKLHNNDIDRARKRAYGEYHEALAAMCKRDDRQQQIVMIIRASDGVQIEKTCLGQVADLPDPEYLVTVNGGTGGGNYKENAIVTIEAIIPENFRFVSWEGIAGLTIVEGDIYSPLVKFVMPAAVVTVTAVLEDNAIEEEPEEPEGT
jgi:hypothetical protein